MQAPTVVGRRFRTPRSFDRGFYQPGSEDRTGNRLALGDSLVFRGVPVVDPPPGFELSSLPTPQPSLGGGNGKGRRAQRIQTTIRGVELPGHGQEAVGEAFNPCTGITPRLKCISPSPRFSSSKAHILYKVGGADSFSGGAIGSQPHRRRENSRRDETRKIVEAKPFQE